MSSDALRRLLNFIPLTPTIRSKASDVGIQSVGDLLGMNPIELGCEIKINLGDFLECLLMVSAAVGTSIVTGPNSLAPCDIVKSAKSACSSFPFTMAEYLASCSDFSCNITNSSDLKIFCREGSNPINNKSSDNQSQNSQMSTAAPLPKLVVEPLCNKKINTNTSSTTPIELGDFSPPFIEPTSQDKIESVAPEGISDKSSLPMKSAEDAQDRTKKNIENANDKNDATSIRTLTLNDLTIGQEFCSIEAAARIIRKCTRSEGFDIHRSRKSETGYYLQCHCSGNKTYIRGLNNVIPRNRKPSIKCGCKWRIVLSSAGRTDGSVYITKLPNPDSPNTHNHEICKSSYADFHQTNMCTSKDIMKASIDDEIYLLTKEICENVKALPGLCGIQLIKKCLNEAKSMIEANRTLTDRDHSSEQDVADCISATSKKPRIDSCT